jgi:hypothetical protein
MELLIASVVVTSLPRFRPTFSPVLEGVFRRELHDSRISCRSNQPKLG